MELIFTLEFDKKKLDELDLTKALIGIALIDKVKFHEDVDHLVIHTDDIDAACIYSKHIEKVLNFYSTKVEDMLA